MSALTHSASVGRHIDFLSSGRRDQTALATSQPLALVNLAPLMEISSGNPETTIALIDGPVGTTHPDFAGVNIREIPGRQSGSCERAASFACTHGTFVAGILCAKRGSSAPAICPDCTLLVRPIFLETISANEQMPSATPQELAAAIVDSVDAGANVINLSAALTQASAKGERELEMALDYSARRGVSVVAAAGNQGAVGSSVITRHPSVIPVIASDLRGRPLSYSNLGKSIGRRGLSAPGEGITSLTFNGRPASGGTSAAAPFVTGTIALLRSLFPQATMAAVKSAIISASGGRRAALVPPLLDAWAAYQLMLKTHSQRLSS
jgi:subtilisin family serine protease